MPSSSSSSPSVATIAAAVGCVAIVSAAVAFVATRPKATKNSAASTAAQPTDAAAATTTVSAVADEKKTAAPAAAATTTTSTTSAPAAAAALELTNQQLSDVTQAINMSNAMKQKGNTYLAAGKLEEAMQCYQDTLDFLSHIPHIVPDVAKTRFVIAANLLHCLLKKGLFVEGQLLASDLLEDPCAVDLMPSELKAKIIYRRAMCSIAMGNRDAAVADLKAADAVAEGKNAEIKKELNNVIGL